MSNNNCKYYLTNVNPVILQQTQVKNRLKIVFIRYTVKTARKSKLFKQKNASQLFTDWH